MVSHTSSAWASDIRDSLDAFRRIVQTLRTGSRDVERRLGVSGAQLFALQQLASTPGASVNELAAATFTHQSSVSAVVHRLVERKLVNKVTDKTDRRRVHLVITPAGHRALLRAPEPVQGRLIAAIAALESMDRHRLAEVLGEIAQTMDAPERPGMFFEDRNGGRPRPKRTPMVSERRARSAARS
jgi:DNA-binding MarR family transcriptional regulator